MGKVAKPLDKVNSVFRKSTPLANKLIGEKNLEKIRPVGTWVSKEAGKIDAAEAEAKDAADLAEEMRAKQAEDLANLDDEENRRIKKLLSGARGTRNYRGGSMFRGRPSNTAGRSAASASGAAGSPGASVMRSGGRAGGLGNAKYSREAVNS